MGYEAAILNPVYMPAVRDILAITNANPAQVTTTFANSYVVGTIIRFVIPNNYGMTLLNGLQCTIIQLVSDTEFLVNVDTTDIDPFVIPTLQPGNNYTSAQIVPIGEVAATLDASFVNILKPIV